MKLTDTQIDDMWWALDDNENHRDFARKLEAALAAPAPAIADTAKPFQERVQPWMLECFGAEIAADRIERNHRFFEEATELVQANGMTRSEAHQLVDYTFDRPVGELRQEVGGVMVTLAALCLASGANMHEAGETELARIWTKIEKIRAKQAAKPKHSPLPQEVIADTAGAKPVAYALASDLDSLGNPRIAGKGCFLNKEPREGFVPIYRAALASPAIDVAPVSEQTLRTLVYQIEDLKPSKHKGNVENAIAILRNAFRSAIDAAPKPHNVEQERAAFIDSFGDTPDGAPKVWSGFQAGYRAAIDAAGASSDDVRGKIARALHYPDCWDTAAYPNLDSAILESMSNFICGTCLDSVTKESGNER